jgi:hypothetical protein
MPFLGMNMLVRCKSLPHSRLICFLLNLGSLMIVTMISYCRAVAHVRAGYLAKAAMIGPGPRKSSANKTIETSFELQHFPMLVRAVGPLNQH